MSVWLTPDLKPIAGGTYFPPDDRYYGRPGFSSILDSLAHQVSFAAAILITEYVFCFYSLCIDCHS